MAGSITANTIQSDVTAAPVFRNSAREVGTLCLAWVNYNGSTQTIRSSFNVSSVTYNGTGDYTINFTTAFANANYSSVGIAEDTRFLGLVTVTTSAVQVFSRRHDNVPQDSALVGVACFA